MVPGRPVRSPMIELRTMGSVDLRGRKGTELRQVLQQPRRLALLCYLAIAKPNAFHRRDTLLALFWPELDQEHARAALRRALYFLRQAIGPDVIIGRGDEEVGVDSHLLRCDVLAFDQAMATGDHAQALELYRGEFLDGFYVQAAQEAEAWLDRERARLKEEASQAAWALARTALDSDLVAATRLARRAIDLGPGNEDSCAELLEQLEARNERSAAVRLYRYAAERIAAELAREP